MEIIRPALGSSVSPSQPPWTSRAPSNSSECRDSKREKENIPTHLLAAMNINSPEVSNNLKPPKGTYRIAHIRSSHNQTKSLSKDPRSGASVYLKDTSHTRTAGRLQRVRPSSDLNLPSFRELGISSSEPVYLTGASGYRDHHQKRSDNSQAANATTTRIVQAPELSQLKPLPTPPEEARPAGWLSQERLTSAQVFTTSQPDSDAGQSSSTQRTGFQTSRPIELPLAAVSQLRTDLPARATWLNEPTRLIVSSFRQGPPAQCVEVISQVLPSQSKERRAKPTYEEILAIVQEEVPASPFITITHGVTQAMAMEEMPKTPPTTPFGTEAAAHYFADDQTIFVNAAVVPVYHGQNVDGADSSAARHRQISAPLKTNITILERYIPPTNSQEIQDFFRASSNRSYLVDRLPELAVGTGTLLLVYPTKAGGRNFAQNYIGPVLDPLLRELVILNNLTVDAAEQLGKMEAVDNMLSFEEMKDLIATLCSNLSQGSHPRAPRSKFTLLHSETAEFVPARETWVNWWVDQEQSRLRHNLVEHHQQERRMSRIVEAGHEVNESTVGMLTRDIIQGVKKSQASAGSVGIEVGVFVIQRVAA